VTWRSFHRWRRGIGPRLLVRVLLFSSAITLLLTSFQLYFDYRYAVRAIESRMSEIEGSYLQSLGESLWNLDSRQIELQIEGILRLPAMRFVEVRETTDRANPLVVSVGHRQEHAALRRVFSLVHTSRGDQELLGVLSIEATFDEVYRALLQKAIIILIKEGTQIFLVSFFILSLTHRLVTRHLTALAGFLGTYDLRQPPPPLRLQRPAPKDKDELDDVLAAFERMRQSLERAYEGLERAYEALQESEQRFRDYAETASDWFWATGPDHAFTYFSQQASFGRDWGTLIGKCRWDVAADVASEPEHWRRHMATLERREPFRDFVYQVRYVDATLGFVSISGKPVWDAEGRFAGYRGVARDITERQRAEEALRLAQAELAHAARLTTLGELTASIAHEINQPLAGVVTSANAGLNWLAANPPNLSKTRETLERILRDGTRGGEVLARIRALLKRTPPAKTLVSVNQIVRDVLALTAGELRQHSIELSLELATTVPAVLGDTVQLQQVLLNLIKNAVEAMSEIANGQRTLRIVSYLGELEGKPAVKVEVSDTGVGLSSTGGTRLFEAFHTTKPQGMGMGLWISRSIIESHHGRLTASSNHGPGATFSIMLPGENQGQA